MPYLNLDIDWFNHRKAVRIVGILGPGAEFLPLKLWAYCAKYHAEDGRLEGYSEDEIESIVGWRGERGKFISAVCNASINLLEKGDNFFQVHDWLDHAGHLAAFKKRAKSAAKRRWRMYASSNAKTETSIAKTEITNAPLEVRIGMVRSTESTKEKGGLGEKTTGSDFRRFTDRFCELYSAKRGHRYIFQHAKDGKCVKRMLEVCDVDTLETLAARFFDSRDEFIAQTDYSLGVFESQLNKLAVNAQSGPKTTADRLRLTTERILKGGGK